MPMAARLYLLPLNAACTTSSHRLHDFNNCQIMRRFHIRSSMKPTRNRALCHIPLEGGSIRKYMWDQELVGPSLHVHVGGSFRMRYNHPAYRSAAVTALIVILHVRFVGGRGRILTCLVMQQRYRVEKRLIRFQEVMKALIEHNSIKCVFRSSRRSGLR